MVPEVLKLTQTLCQFSWLDLLRGDQAFISSSLAGSFSQEAVSLFTDPKSSSVKIFIPQLSLPAFGGVFPLEIQGLKTGTTVLIYSCQAVSAGYRPLSSDPASSCANWGEDHTADQKEQEKP